MADRPPRSTAPLDALIGRPLTLGLDGIRPALAGLGDPQDRIPCVLVGGTNGKGSTAALLTSILRAGGYRTGFFFSPAFGELREQIQVDGTPLAAAQLDHLLGRVIGGAESARPGRITAFEALTAAAFAAFERSRVQIAVVEVGMGGERDCTNVILRPRASALVSVGLDHRDLLGPSLAHISEEKAGIFRRGRPAVIGWLESEAEEPAVARARRTGSRIVLARRTIQHLEYTPAGRRYQQVECRTIRGGTYRARLRLPGAHQARNAALAVLLAEELAADGFGKLEAATIVHGLESCRWPGRLEWLEGGSRPVLLDVAHNPQAAASLVDYLVSAGLRPDLLFGTFADKDHASMLGRLLPHVEKLSLTSTDHPRSAPVQLLARGAGSAALDGETARLAGAAGGRFEDALDRALRQGSGPLLISGSVDLVARARRELLARGWKA